MKNLRDASIKQVFDKSAKTSSISQYEVEVGVNDYLVAPKDVSIGLAENVSSNSISGYIDMGDYHAVFNYRKNLMSLVVDLVRDIDAESVKEIKLFMPEKSKVLDFNRRMQSTYGFKMNQIESNLFVKGVNYSISHKPFTAPKVASNSDIKVEVKPSSPKHLMRVA